MQNYLVERLQEKIQYKDATSCDKMLKSVQRVGTSEKENSSQFTRHANFSNK